MKTPSITKRFPPIAIALVIFSSGCTLKRPEGHRRVTIQIPPMLAEKLRTKTSEARESRTALSASSCLALNVSGAGITNETLPSFCITTNTSIGVTAGWVDFNTSSIEVMVPAGSARTLQIFAKISASGACSDFFTSLSESSTTAYEIAQTTIDITEDTTVSLPIKTFDESQIVLSCSGTSTGTAGVWDQSTWDDATWGE